jgi:transcription initiation factor IIE alpha subunit
MMQINFLKHIVEKVAGAGAIPIVEILYSKRDVNEFLIAKKMEMTIQKTSGMC